MKTVSTLDKNFDVKTDIDKDDIIFYNAEEAPFKIYGIFKENGLFRRMPEKVAKSVNECVAFHHTNTAGGRVRFRTDSKYVAINAEMEGLGKFPHMTFAGAIGFDLYVDDFHEKTFAPPFEIENGYEGVHDFWKEGMKEVTINFPLYSDVKNLFIGLEETAKIEPPSPYVNEKPIVYYGSSITQGGCASRPGMSYQGIISREFNCDYINLGFSAGARGEDEITDYIKGLDMSVFVLDYDHNAPTPEHLEQTHEKMFKTIRNAHPDLPIIMMSKPNHVLRPIEEKSLQVIERTYNNAIAAGDKNVYMLNNKQLTALCGCEGSVDKSHPTDFGLASMAKALIEVLKEINLK